MNDIELPEPVFEFVELLKHYLGGVERRIEFVDREDGAQTRWVWRVDGVGHEARILIHETQASLGTGRPEYRVRIAVDIDEEQGRALHSLAAFANRFCVLGALMAYTDQTVAIGSQFVIGYDNLQTCAALTAAAAAYGAMSHLESIRRSFLGEKPQVGSLSAWSGIDFERLQYELAHIGGCRAGERGCRIELMTGVIDLSALHSNPYFGGGLLVLAGAAKAGLGIEGAAPVNEMNLCEWLVGDVPMFGGWYEDGDHLRFVSFLPNMLKEVDQLMVHIVSWAQRRLAQASDTVASAMAIRSMGGDAEQLSSGLKSALNIAPAAQPRGGDMSPAELI
jgi:hypothetical protein